MQPTAPAQSPERRLTALLHEAEILSRMRDLPLAAAVLDAEIARTRSALSGAQAEYAAESARAVSPFAGSTLPEPPASARELGTRFRLGPAAFARGAAGASASGSDPLAPSHLLGQGLGLGQVDGQASEGAPSSVVPLGSANGGGGSVGVRKRIRLKVPAEKYPEYNFVGRLLGPRGATLKKLERDTGCKIMIRGRGSIRKDKEADVRGKPGWEHVFNENLHVVIEVSDAPDEHFAQLAVTRAREAVELLLVPVPEEKDSLKRQQLRELAILNGTYRASDSHLSLVASAAAHQLRMAPTPPPTPHHTTSHAVESPSGAAVAAAAAAHAAAHAASMSNRHGLGSGSLPYGSMRSQTGSHSGRLPPASPVLRSTHRSASSNGGEIGGPSRTGSSSSRDISLSNSGLRIPSLDIEAMNESFLASPAATSAGVVPASSPTIVDPDIYPFPPTPTTYGSPIWSPVHSAPAAPPPLPTPLHQSSHAQFSTPPAHSPNTHSHQQFPQYSQGLQRAPAGSPQLIQRSTRSNPPLESERPQQYHQQQQKQQHQQPHLKNQQQEQQHEKQQHQHLQQQQQHQQQQQQHQQQQHQHQQQQHQQQHQHQHQHQHQQQPRQYALLSPSSGNLAHEQQDYHQSVGATAPPSSTFRTGVQDAGQDLDYGDIPAYRNSSGVRSYGRQSSEEREHVLYGLTSLPGEAEAGESQSASAARGLLSPAAAVAAAVASGGVSSRRSSSSRSSFDGERLSAQGRLVTSRASSEVRREHGGAGADASGDAAVEDYHSAHLGSDGGHAFASEGRTIGFRFQHPEAVDDGEHSSSAAALRALQE